MGVPHFTVPHSLAPLLTRLSCASGFFYTIHSPHARVSLCPLIRGKQYFPQDLFMFSLFSRTFNCECGMLPVCLVLTLYSAPNIAANRHHLHGSLITSMKSWVFFLGTDEHEAMQLPFVFLLVLWWFQWSCYRYDQFTLTFFLQVFPHQTSVPLNSHLRIAFPPFPHFCFAEVLKCSRSLKETIKEALDSPFSLDWVPFSPLHSIIFCPSSVMPALPGKKKRAISE